jgi:cell division protease FtsH
MDGFDSSTSVVVLAATNRPDVLDAALLRPGRFDRRVSVQPPDKNGRRKILEVHTRGVPLDPAVDLDSIASTTPGMVGADLANLVNEAALLAARRNHEQVQMEDFTDALERIVLGAERQIMLSEEDRARIAYHEAGHAIVGMMTPGADPVRKVSIIPRGMALGVTLASPTSDRFNYTEHYLRTRIKVALGGRVAEELVFESITTGAESDIRQLTEIARHMVGSWGMSGKVGPISVLPQDGEVGPFGPLQSVAPETQKLIDAEVRRLVDELHAETTRVLTDNRDKLDALANAQLEHETLDEADAYAAAGVERVADRAPEPAPITAQ